jgi:hypothetical protein
MRRLITALSLGVIILAPAACADRDDAGEADAASAPAGQIAMAEPGATVASADTIEVWKDPNCGCCKSWVEHMQKHGFTVVIHDTPDLTPVKQKHGVGADLASCHTGIVHGYAVEGHVPADLVRKMLDEKPAITGLAVPGMPMGSPGMEGGMKQKYDIIAFTKDGERKVYASR